MIQTSYGHWVGGFTVGGGYGRDPELAAEADRLADMLVSRFGEPIEKRGNSDGRSCGAFHDKPKEPGMLWGQTVFGLSAIRRPEGIKYTALLREPLNLHRTFATAEAALGWLSDAMQAKGRRGFHICEACGGDTETVLDGEAWCTTCKRYQ